MISTQKSQKSQNSSKCFRESPKGKQMRSCFFCVIESIFMKGEGWGGLVKLLG